MTILCEKLHQVNQELVKVLITISYEESRCETCPLLECQTLLESLLQVNQFWVQRVDASGLV
jgi:hypothetical protein